MTIEELRTAANNSTQKYFHFERMLIGLRQYYFHSKADHIITSNAKYADYRQVYDSVKMSTLFSDQVKKQLLFGAVDELIERFSLDDRLKYWEKFRQDVPDSAMHSYISNKYSLNQQVSKELFLQTLDGSELNFEDLLARHRNKVVYVDFWASWCAPCIRALPASKQLQQEYKNKEVVFIYLSIDEDINKWKRAAAKHLLNDSLSSFVVANRHTSRMLDDLALSSIPRYMIYDKSGNLVHQNAPGPDSKESRKLLDKYLKEPGKTASL